MSVHVAERSGRTSGRVAAVEVNWRQVGVFLGLTFGLSWLIDLVLWLTVGYSSPAAGGFLQLQMLVPALCAIVLQRYVFKAGLLHATRYRETPRRVFGVFLIYTAVVLVTTVVGAAVPDLAVPLSGLSVVMGFLSSVALIVIRWRSTRDGMAQAGLSLGKVWQWLVWGLAFVIFYVSQTGLDTLFGLGHAVDVTPLTAGSGMPASVFLVVSFVYTRAGGAAVAATVAAAMAIVWVVLPVADRRAARGGG